MEIKTKKIAGQDFKEISTEEWREYTFSNGKVRIDKPMWIHIKRQTDSLHSHRIMDGSGVSHYIPSGWLSISWKSPEGKEFIFIS